MCTDIVIMKQNWAVQFLAPFFGKECLQLLEIAFITTCVDLFLKQVDPDHTHSNVTLKKLFSFVFIFVKFAKESSTLWSNIGEIIEKYANSQKRTSEQKLKKEFDELISVCEAKMERENGNWQQEFGKLKTDFERVHFYLRHFPNLEKARNIFKAEMVQSAREQLRRCNGKSDKVSGLFLWLSKRKREEMKPSASLRFSTLAIFYASTDRQLSLALAQRSILLYENGLIDEAISDAHKALKFGFCSKKCRKRATKVKDPRSTVNKHIYDCNGILPNILLDEFDSAQLAYMCIGNTDPQRIIDCLCRTGVYKKGRGHQAFRGTKKVRRTPPEVFDSRDYQSIAWTSTNSSDLGVKLLLELTRVAIFLTFCLLIAGYPMDTEDSLWSTQDEPSSKNRSDRISVSWLAACVLHHLHSTNVTSFFLTQKIFYRLRSSLEFAQLNIGLIFYPAISLINHSCDPNALVLMSGNGAAGIVALKPIPANSEISICYLLSYWQRPRGIRRNLLSEGFLFLCKCEACAKNWRVVKGNNTLILCPGCKKGSKNICKASLPAVNFYNKLVHKYLRKIERLKDRNDASSESIAYVTKVINQIDSFIAPPSDVLVKVKRAYEYLINLKYSSWTLAPKEMVTF
nr:SET and MYND domain containing protein 4 [Hymenolepis microstoma]CDS31242.1 SET and MYND domain containing protein 4 [Hymenolepis microstoma]